MKKILTLLMLTLMLVSTALGEVITLPAEEMREAAQPSLALDQTEVRLASGKLLRLYPNLTGTDVRVSYTWETDNRDSVRVYKGQVSGHSEGMAVVTCSCTLPDGTLLSASCLVTVYIPVSAVKFKKGSLSLNVGDVVDSGFTVYPQNATDARLLYTTSDSAVAVVAENGCITAVGPGRCTVTAEAADGSGKNKSLSVSVTTMTPVEAVYTVTERRGLDIPVPYYGSSAPRITTAGRSAMVMSKFDPEKHQVLLRVIPFYAGGISITVANPDSKDRVKLKAKIAQSALYTNEDYPRLRYIDAQRFPDSFRGERVSLKGTVRGVSQSENYQVITVRSQVSHRGDVVVLLPMACQTVPVLKNDTVWIYGIYSGNAKSYGNPVPCVEAERVDLSWMPDRYYHELTFEE